MKYGKHWQDPVNALLGAGLALSPWLLGYQDQTMAMASAVVAGLALVAAALGAFFMPKAWEEWTEGALGLWMVASPWLLSFATHQTAMMTAVLIGVVVMALALWVLRTDSDYRRMWDHGPAAH